MGECVQCAVFKFLIKKLFISKIFSETNIYMKFLDFNNKTLKIQNKLNL